MASAILSSADERSCGVVFRQDSNAVAAAAYARSTSSAPDIGAAPYTSPVVGSMTSYVAPSAASTRCPFTMFLKASGMGQVKRLPPGQSRTRNEIRCEIAVLGTDSLAEGLSALADWRRPNERVDTHDRPRDVLRPPT